MGYAQCIRKAKIIEWPYMLKLVTGMGNEGIRRIWNLRLGTTKAQPEKKNPGKSLWP